MTNVSINKKSPRNRIPESFRVERLESRVLLSADPVLTPIAMAMLPHAAHVAAAPHATGDVGVATAGQSAAATHALFDAQSLSTHAAVLQSTQSTTTLDVKGVSVTPLSHAATTFSTAQNASSAAGKMTVQAVAAPATASLASAPGRMHILSAPPGNGITWTTNQVGASINASGSLNINLPSTLTVTVNAPGSATLGAAGDWVYGNAAGQNLAIVRSGAGNVAVNFPAALPSLVTSGQYALHNLTLGAVGTPVGSVHFSDVVNLTGNLTIYATGTVQFDSTLTLTNNATLQIIGASNVIFGGAVNLTNLDGDAANGTSTVAGAAGNILIQADHITFPSGANAFSGSGTLTILPTTAGHSIFFADPNTTADATALAIHNSDLQYWASTFTNIYIGSASGGHADGNAGAVYIGATQNAGTGSAPTVTDNVTFYGSSVTVTTPFSTTGPAYTFYGTGNITFDAVSGISLANTVIAGAGSGNLVATSASGAITESGAGTYLAATNLVATAVTGITLPSTQVTNLTATNSGTTGSISVTQDAAGGALTVLQALQSNGAGNGNIAVATTSGNLTVASSGTGVVTAGSGNVNLTVQGGSSTLTVSDNVTAHAGTVTMTAPGLVTLGAQTSTTGGAVGISSSAGSIQVNADVLAAGGALSLSSLNDIAMTAGTTLSSLNAGNTGAISLTAGGNDILSTLSAGGTLSVTATGGAITSALQESTNASQLNLVGSTAKATLTSSRGIGARGADIQTSISEITLSNSTSGDVFIDQTQTGNLQLGVVAGANAAILGGTTGTASIVTTDGGITVNTAVVDTASGGVAGQTGQLLIQANKVAAASADVTVNANVSTASGSVEIKSAGTINVGSPSAITIAANGAGQTVYLQAAASVVFAATSQVNAAGNVWVSATGGHVTLGQVASTGGIVAIDAGDTILDAQSNGSQAVANITASSVRLASVSGVGTSSNSVVVAGVGGGSVTFAGTSTAASTSGGIFLISQTALTVGSVGATLVNATGPTATPTSVGDAGALNSVAVSGASNLVLKSQGALTVANAIGLAGPVTIASTTYSTNLRLDAAGQLDVDAAIGNIGGAYTSYAGNMSLLGNTGVSIGAGLAINTLGGTLDVEANGGAVQMGAASLLASSTGAIRLQAGNDIAVARVSTAGNVAINAIAGNLTDANGNTTGTPGTLNVQAAGLRLYGGSIGTGTDELQVNVGTLTAATAAGSIYVLDTAAETIGSVAVTVNQVNLNGGTSTVTDATQSGVATTSANGNIVLQDGAGTFTIASAISANGSGNVLLQAQSGSVAVNAGVASGSGNVSVLGSSGVAVGSGTAQTISTGGAGSIDVESAGTVAMASGSLLGAGSGAVRVVGSGILLARIATTGNASLTALSGSITDANGNSDAAGIGTINVTAAGLRLNAATALGSSTDALQTAVSSVSGFGGSGVYLLNNQAESVDSVTVSARTVGANGVASPVAELAQAGLTTTSNGNIVLQTTAGDLTINSFVNANGSGNVLLQAKAGTLAIASDIFSNASGSGVGDGAGNLSLWGATGVTVAASLPAATTGSGTIDVESGAAVTMGANSGLVSTSGAIGVQAATSVALARLVTNGGAAVTALAGSITDADAQPNVVTNAAPNVTASAVRLKASNGIGTGSDALRTQATNVTAAAGAGGVYLMSTQSETISHATVTVNKVAQDGTAATTLVQALQNGVATTGGGNVVLDAVAGDVTLSSTSASLPAVTATGGGNVLVRSEAGVVNLNASVYSNASGNGTGSGNITVLGASGVNVGLVSGNATLGTGSGIVDVESGNGSVTMAANALIKDTSGAVRLAAAQNVAVGRVNSGANVSLWATNGAVTDANGNLTVNGSGTINVAAAGLAVNAGGNAGSSTDALRTHVSTLAAGSTNGSVFVIDDQGVTVAEVDALIQQVGLDGGVAATISTQASRLVTTNNGNLVLEATAGDITLTDASASHIAVSAGGSGNILVQADAGRVLVNSAVSGTTGNVTLLGAQGVSTGAVDITTAGTIDIESNAGSVAMVDGTLVDSSQSDVRVSAAQNIGVGLIFTPRDVSLVATSGSITDANGNSNANVNFTWNVRSDGLRLNAGTGAGTSTDALQVESNTISENVGAGGGYVIDHAAAVVVGSVSASVNKTGLNGATTVVNDAAQAGLVSRSNGNLVLQATSGDLTLTSASSSVAAVNANGSGNVLLQSVAGAVNANANVYSGGGSGSGNISVLGATGVNIGANGVVATLGTGAGTVDVESAAGSVAMSAHSVIASGNSDIRVVAAHNIGVAEIEAGNDVALTAGGGIADTNGNTTGGSGNILNVVAQGLRLNAGSGAGTGSDALQVQVGGLSASVGSSGLFMVDDETVVVGIVTATSQDVGLDGNVTAVADANLFGVTAAAGGDIVLQASTGDISVNAAINAAGDGNVRLDSVSGVLTLAAGVADSGTGAGSISLIGGGGVHVTPGVAVSDTTSGASSVDIESSNAGVIMGSGATLTGHAVRVIAAQDVGVGRVLASGNVALTATSGQIYNVGNAGNNVTANALYLSAGQSAGSAGSALQTQVSTLSAAVGNLGLNLVNDQALATGSVSTSVKQVGLDGNTTTVTTATASDAIASAGAVTLEATSGDISLGSANASVAAINANGSGNVLVEAVTGSINVNANVLDGSGNTSGGISLLAAQAVTIGANAPVNIIDGTGAMDIEALDGDIAMSAASTLQAGAGTVRAVAEGGVTLGGVQASGNTLVQAVTGALAVDANVTAGAGNSTGTLTLHASGDVSVASGVSVNDGAGAVAITSDLGNVNLAASSLVQSFGGTVRVVAAQSVATGTVRTVGDTLIQAQGGSLHLNNNVQSGTGAQAGTLSLLASGDVVAASGITLRDGAGRVDIESSGGNVTLASDSTLMSDGGTVNVNAARGVALGTVLADANTRVQAQGGAIAVNGGLRVGTGASTGSLGLVASGDIDVASGWVVSSGAGSLDLESGGSVAMGAGALVESVSGAVRVVAANSIAVGQVSTGAGVSLTATAGSITDASGGVDVVADGVRLAAGNGVGSASAALEIQANTVTASAGAGGITLLSYQGVAVGSVGVSVNQVSTTGATSTVTDATQAGLVTSANGSISLQARLGDITLTPAGGNAIAANGTGNVLVQSLDANGNVDAFAGITSGTGNIDVIAGNDVVLYTPGSAAAQISTALPGLVNVHAVNGTVISGGVTQPGQTVNLDTDQLHLDAPLVGTNNQLNIGPSTVASNPAAVVVGGPAAGGTGALYLSQDQAGLIEAGFKDVDIGSTIPGQVVSLVGQDASGNASTNVFVNPVTLTASGAGGTVVISGGLQATSLDIEGSRTGTTLASAAVSTSGAIVVDDNVIVTGATSLGSGTGGAADLTVNGTITGSGSNALSMSAGGGNIVVTGAVSGLGALNVTQAASLTFQSTLAVTGNLVINATGVIDFAGGVTIAAGGSLTIVGASQVTFASGADFTQAGNVTIATNALNLNGGAGSIRGAGTLTLQAATASGAIHVGSGTQAGALNIGAQAVSALAPGFHQVVIGAVDTATGHAAGGAGAVDIQGSTSLTAFAAPLAVYASTITVDAGGTGVHVAGALTLDAVGQIQLGSDVTTTVAANVSLTSATGTIAQAAQAKLSSLGGNVTLATGNSSNATLSVIDTRATGSDVGANVDINVQNGRVIDVNADATVNVYAAAVTLQGYGITNTAGSSPNSVLKVRAPVVYVASPTGTVVADAGQDGRTNYNALDHGTMYEELIAVGATTRVTLPGDAVLGGGPESLASQGVTTLDASLIHAASIESLLNRLFAPAPAAADADGVSLSPSTSADDAAPTGYVLGSQSGQPSVSGVDSYGDGAVEWWTEALEA